MIENERSFLVRDIPDVNAAPRKRIEQHYLSSGRDPLRIRRVEASEGIHRELTKKLTIDDSDLSRKEEINIPLTSEEYADLEKLSKRGVEKTRREIPLEGGLVAELDTFHGDLEGFMKVEVEFPSDAAREAFVPPSWFGRDVSQEAWSKNSELAGKTLAEIAAHLD